MPGQVQQVDVGDLTFDVRVDGPEDGRPVLLLHGFPETSLSWASVTPLLTEAGLRTYAPDQLGYSPGARPDEVAAYSTPSLAQVTADLLTALDVHRADVVGHDWGANVAWALAGWHPDRVRSLTAVSVPHPAAYTVAYRTDPEQKERSGYIRLFWQPGKAEDVLLADDAPAAAADAVGRRGRLRRAGGGDRRVRRGAVGTGSADRGAELVPGDELERPGRPGRACRRPTCGATATWPSGAPPPRRAPTT